MGGRDVGREAEREGCRVGKIPSVKFLREEDVCQF